MNFIKSGFIPLPICYPQSYQDSSLLIYFSRSPESGSLVHSDFLQVESVRMKLVGNYIMYYLPDREGMIIYILRIIYGKRNMDEILKKLD